jgi:hypothetical protein
MSQHFYCRLPFCPRCAWREAIPYPPGRRFKCKACHHQFSVTSGTIFASRKLVFVDLLGAIALFVNAATRHLLARAEHECAGSRNALASSAIALMRAVRSACPGRRLM